MTCLPKLLNLLEHLEKAWSSVARVGRKISSAEKWPEFGCEEGIEGPATLAGGGLNESHVNFVDIRPFLAIDFDADEVFVEKFCNVFALEGFTFHDVAPMASGITDAYEDRFVLLARLGEGLLAPGIPIHGIELVLKQVRGLLPSQSVGVSMGLGRC